MSRSEATRATTRRTGWKRIGVALLAAAAVSAGPSRGEPALLEWGADPPGPSNGRSSSRLDPTLLAIPDAARTVAVSAGSYHAVALRSDGTVYEWGSSGFVEIGRAPEARLGPVPVPFPAGVRPVAVRAGGAHTLALMADGSVYAWGENDFGQLGTGTTRPSRTPLQVMLPGSVRAAAVSAGSRHSLVLGTDGKIYAWGLTRYDSKTGRPEPSVLTPAVVPLPAGVRAVVLTAGGTHSLALGSDGRVYAWGSNANGELGRGTTEPWGMIPSPVLLPEGVRAVDLAAADGRSAVVGSDRRIYAWGENGHGQLGSGTVSMTRGVTRPVAVSLPGGISTAAIAMGPDHTLALGSDGKLYSWGANGLGQLGDGTGIDRFTPAAVRMPAGGLTAIASGGRYSLALGADGRVYAWGSNSSGELGRGTLRSTLLPAPVLLPGALRISVGHRHALAVGTDGTVYAWGDNSSGQLGTGSSSTSDAPRPVALPEGAKAVVVAAGNAHSLALGLDGRVYAWGDNSSGQLGIGGEVRPGPPVAVALPAGVRGVALAAGTAHSMALGSDGTIYAWGRNGQGQLGTGTFDDSPLPSPVTLAPEVTATALSSYGDHTLALGSDGQVYAWGYDAHGQLAGASPFLRSQPRPARVRLPGGIPALAVSAGTNHSLALGFDGTVYAWGNDAAGQLGDYGALTSVPLAESVRPVPVSLPARAVAISAGDDHSLAVTEDGRVYAWGGDASGQLGDGATISRARPRAVNLPPGTRAADISAGKESSLALVARSILPGDVNGDGVVDLKDVTLAQQAAVHAVELTPDRFRSADVRCDGAVTIADVVLILKKVLGSSDPLPGCH